MANLSVRSLMIGAVLVLVIAPDATQIASAQPYCAVYDNGSRGCGIPTLQSCQQSVDGVGGICEPTTRRKCGRIFSPDGGCGRRSRAIIQRPARTIRRVVLTSCRRHPTNKRMAPLNRLPQAQVVAVVEDDAQHDDRDRAFVMGARFRHGGLHLG